MSLSSDRKLNILVAYPYMTKDVIEILESNQNSIRFLLDSGAFTAWKANKEIKVEEYCDFIESLPFKPWRYFTLDVIGDPEGTIDNYNHMLGCGLKPVPIFTRGEDPSMIDMYYNTSEVVGIGGLVGTRGNKGFVKSIMKKVGDRKVHWLGFNAKEFLSYYKPYMCDSSSWSSSVRYASCKLYDRNGRWYSVSKEDFAERPTETIFKLLTEYEMDPSRLADKSEWKNSGSGKYALEEMTCKSWVRYQIDIGRKLGVKFFLACASGWQVKLMHQAFDFWNKKGF